MSSEQIKRQLALKAVRAIVGGAAPLDDHFASRLGGVSVAMPNETWPTCEGKLLMPVCQLNLTELPYRPSSLADIALLTLFVDQEEMPEEDALNGDRWLLRAYPSLEGLVPIKSPEESWPVVARSIRWELVEADYPAWDYAISKGYPLTLEDKYDKELESLEGTKIGGWPRIVQCDIDWDPYNRYPEKVEYVLQIGSDERVRLAWGDEGFAYIGRGTGEISDRWMFAWQCY